MRKLTKIITGITITAATAMLVATPGAAHADPPTGSNGKQIVPASYDIVDVGDNTDDALFDQFASDYDKTIPAKDHGPTHPRLYSWDALPPGKTTPGVYLLKPKAGCKSIVRPNGSINAWEALIVVQKIGSHYCIDFARSASYRAADGGAPNTVTYVVLARDALTWATRSKAHGGSDAPASLNRGQLEHIFTCKTTNWKQVGGKNGAIKVYLPQFESGTLATWETFMGIDPDKVRSCISLSPEDSEGEYAGFDSPNAIFIYSVADWVAQQYHSPKCGSKPAKSQNQFGCNRTGYLSLGEINGRSPITSAKIPTINPGFPSNFFYGIYDVVRGTDKISQSNLAGLLGSKGYLCTNATAKKDIQNYGFLFASNCGALNTTAAPR